MRIKRKQKQERKTKATTRKQQDDGFLLKVVTLNTNSPSTCC